MDSLILLKGIKRQSHDYETSSQGQAMSPAAVTDLMFETVSGVTNRSQQENAAVRCRLTNVFKQMNLFSAAFQTWDLF